MSGFGNMPPYGENAGATPTSGSGGSMSGSTSGSSSSASGMTTAMFRDRASAEKAYDALTAGVALPPLRLARARRRWGSCAGDGTVRINWRLVMAPDAVRRSVVAHEIAHLVHFDHGPAFHALLAALYEGEIAQANRWLKREGPRLYVPFG